MKKIVLSLSIFICFVGSTPGSSQSSSGSELPSSSINFYLNRLSGMLAGRALDNEERQLVKSKGIGAVSEILEAWMQTPFFIESVRSMLQSQLSINGKTSSVDFDLPGNLAAYLAKNQLPYSDIINANYCVNDGGSKIPCDTGAPYTAGVLTTKAYMVNGAGRFNLRRARKMLKQFACRQYPLNSQLQIPIRKPDLIAMFQDDQPSGTKDQFGNGTACYSCHSQFGAHAQFFVKFDSFGTYQPNATGAQDTSVGVEAGRSTNNLYTSHLITDKKSSEESQMFGHQVSHLGEAAQVLSENPLFLECGIRNFIQYYLRLLPSDAELIKPELLRDIQSRIQAESKDPSFQIIIRHTFSHPIVIQSIVNAGGSK